MRHITRSHALIHLFLLLVGPSLLWVGPAVAHDDDADHADDAPVVTAQQLYGATPSPDRVVLTISGDPRTSISVNWRTSADVKQGLVEIAEATPGPDFPKQAERTAATRQRLDSDLGPAHYHSHTWTDLTPGTKYAYRVGSLAGNWTEWYQFTTAAAEDEPFSFVYFGDAQNNIRSMWSRVVRQAYQDAPRSAFLLHAGDLVNSAESDSEWGEWFHAAGWLNAQTPVIAVPGNHEQKRRLILKSLSRHWRPTFTFPENGPSGLEETCYTFTYHNLRVIALDSNRSLVKQTAWLEQTLAKNESTWVICTFHHPIYSTGKGRDNPLLRAAWKPLFDRYKVDLVLQGHDHTYGRTGFKVPSVLPLQVPVEAGEPEEEPTGEPEIDAREGSGHVENVPTGVQAVDQQSGTVYVVSVSGPKMYHHTRMEFMRRVAEDTQLYQVIHIDGPTLRFEARTAIGQLYDAFELRKRDGEINELVELPPEVPENVRP